ncbi:TIGR03826 family flagellar region protein [Aureibacillus halotolerans]|uniref:Flagellar operon protein (TIGR03826 family) n=1 Tax=Aureibacillus halotolerans TaxID=1508390 RepID=A0A4R6TUT1_9BACI|nr:TIGR03826 family flagellar region protein [Aureibacillus halotolerans]TDQ36926.1 flagellar operon protein (TIGR03826 family) [Aureibacillus halotolerans]
MNIDNCPSCGALYYKTLTQDVCRSCFQLEEEQFDRVYAFLKQKQNRSASMQEVVEQTSVKESLLIKYIKKGRLRTSQFPNLGYPCARCNTMINQDKLCNSCREDIAKDLASFDMQQAREAEKNRQPTYHVLSKKNDKR